MKSEEGGALAWQEDWGGSPVVSRSKPGRAKGLKGEGAQGEASVRDGGGHQTQASVAARSKASRYAGRWAGTGACLPFASTAHAKFFDSRAFDLRSRAERATVRGDHSLPGVRGPTNDGQAAAHVIEESGFVHSSSSKNCPGSLRKANTLVGLSGPCPRRLPAASA